MNIYLCIGLIQQTPRLVEYNRILLNFSERVSLMYNLNRNRIILRLESFDNYRIY